MSKVAISSSLARYLASTFCRPRRRRHCWGGCRRRRCVSEERAVRLRGEGGASQRRGRCVSERAMRLRGEGDASQRRGQCLSEERAMRLRGEGNASQRRRQCVSSEPAAEGRRGTRPRLPGRGDSCWGGDASPLSRSPIRRRQRQVRKRRRLRAASGRPHQGCDWLPSILG